MNAARRCFVRAAQVEQHAVVPGDRDDEHVGDNGSVGHSLSGLLCYNRSMVFYKYAGKFKFGIKILEDLRLKITPPNEFNDPFELTPRSKFTMTRHDMISRAKTDPEYYRSTFEDMKNDGYSQKFEQFIAMFPTITPQMFKHYRKLMREQLVKLDMKSLNEASQKLGILCVSKPPNSIPMWSHYADDHRGIAIGLDLPKIGSNLPGPPFWRVKYRIPRLGVNPWLSPTSPEWLKQVIDTIFVKSRDWIYEQEYRRVFRLADLIHTPPDDKGKRHYFIDINGSEIREIIFGCRIDEPDEQRIKAELNRRPKTFGHVKLFRCKRHDARFELEIVPTD